jgi:ethanolamine ammonia-lyase small subunit
VKPMVEVNPWQQLRQFTQARIALGRAGNSLPTRAVLEFGMAHALARDAVHTPLPKELLLDQLHDAGLETLCVHSAAQNREQYLRRPDYGRALSGDSRQLICKQPVKGFDVVVVIADGLSAVAPHQHAMPLIKALLPLLDDCKWGPIVVAEQARVALGDEVGELLQARQLVMLIGERPGLSSPDSLGIYLTHEPRVGRTDAERNCISNVRPAGMGYQAAAHKLCYLMAGAHRLGQSGVALKDDSDDQASRHLV